MERIFLLSSGSITQVVFDRSICLLYVVKAPVAASNWYPTLTCGSSKLVLPSSHTLGNRHDWWAKPDEGPRCCVCLYTRPFPSYFSLSFTLSSASLLTLPSSPIVEKVLWLGRNAITYSAQANRSFSH
ncbi:unnamed protein product [Schistocephalus solidus]|uniref:Secreted protein n=1 Tax=Schistocephalus solidus TaxID=70667 RepID=A0A183TAM0_SCHSO|nr:unnamed protein product [Schistocephalus solidus]